VRIRPRWPSDGRIYQDMGGILIAQITDPIGNCCRDEILGESQLRLFSIA